MEVFVYYTSTSQTKATVMVTPQLQEQKQCNWEQKDKYWPVKSPKWWCNIKKLLYFICILSVLAILSSSFWKSWFHLMRKQDYKSTAMLAALWSCISAQECFELNANANIITMIICWCLAGVVWRFTIVVYHVSMLTLAHVHKCQ